MPKSGGYEKIGGSQDYGTTYAKAGSKLLAATAQVVVSAATMVTCGSVCSAVCSAGDSLNAEECCPDPDKHRDVVGPVVPFIACATMASEPVFWCVEKLSFYSVCQLMRVFSCIKTDKCNSLAQIDSDFLLKKAESAGYCLEGKARSCCSSNSPPEQRMR